MRPSYRTKLGITLVLIVIFFFVLNLSGFSKNVKNFFYLVSSPVQKNLWQQGQKISDLFETIAEIKNLKKENEELKLRNQELMVQIAQLIELRKENEILRTALGIGLEKDFKLNLAEVVGKDISQDSILINKGSKHGIPKNFPVITQQKALVGKVSEVYENFSRVMLISNKESFFDAKILENDISGVVKGRGGLQLLLDFVPHEKEIEEGDIIITTSLGGIFPQGLLVGQIEKVEKSDIEPFQQAKIKPAFDIGKLKTLFVIIEF
jgi:rod shape-determining protein MreC